MQYNKVTKYLLEETQHETAQKQSQQFIPDYPHISENATETIPTLPNELFFKNKDIFISKHNRYAPYPVHSHQFLELNYVYKGKSRQVINGEMHQLIQGDILLMDTGSNHSIEVMGEDDILINIIFQETQISIDWLSDLNDHQSILYQMLLNKNKKNNPNFVIIKRNDQSNIQNIIHQMLNEYIFPTKFSSEIINNYLPILFYELARSLPFNVYDEYNIDSNDDLLYEVLNIIDSSFRDITLDNLATSLNYNKNYLSNLIKQKSGFTFTELVNKKRLMAARIEIQSTRKPINEIAKDVGYSNLTYFYKQYSEYFNNLPSNDR